MSGREWKRGEVGTFSGKPALRTAKGWTHYDGSVGGLHQDNSPFLRPLVVIDPEDREQVERLIVAYSSQPRWHTGYTRDRIDAMQAALREFANPTPVEPTDPTARVTDRRENVWRLLADGEWVCTSGPDIGEYLVWRQLAAERGPLAVEVTQ